MFEKIAISRRERILTVALDRPHRLNAFDAQLHSELPRALAFAAEDPGSDVVVLTGSGRAFSAGGDLDWQLEAARRPVMFEATVREARQIVLGILDCEKPVVARINGPAVGLGATIALLCDVSFMARTAYISDPHVNVGMVAGDGGALIWPQLIGFARAKEFLFTGDSITADDAARIGLVNHAVDDADLDDRVEGFCDRLAAQPQLALRYTKQTANVALKQLAPAVLDVGLGYESLTNVSAEHVAALTAFKAKRTPPGAIS
jgi:enoyl-CoA hydratase